MWRYISGTNWLLILGLIFGSAGLAILGDILGLKYGKKRISLFGLRPKYTSRIITALTGAIIAVGILGIMSAFSQDVRTALFGMKYIQQQIYDLQLQLIQSREIEEKSRISLDLTGFELNSLKNNKLILEQEKNDLETNLKFMREESEQLKQDLKSMRSQVIALNANVLLAQTNFDPGMTREQIIYKFDDLKQQVRLNILARISQLTFTRLRDIPVEFESEQNLINIIANSENRYYVRALSDENYTYGENMHVKIKWNYGISNIIYNEGDAIYRKFFKNDINAEETLHIFLRGLKTQAIADGILPEPSTNNVGTMDGEEFFSSVEMLSEIDSPVIINAIASRDIYTEGPIEIYILFED